MIFFRAIFRQVQYDPTYRQPELVEDVAFAIRILKNLISTKSFPFRNKIFFN